MTTINRTRRLIGEFDGLSEREMVRTAFRCIRETARYVGALRSGAIAASTRNAAAYLEEHIGRLEAELEKLRRELEESSRQGALFKREGGK